MHSSTGLFTVAKLLLVCWSCCCCCRAWSFTKPTIQPPQGVHFVTDRRSVLKTTTTASVLLRLLPLPGILSPAAAHAAIPVTPAEAIRQSAANLPGYGPSNVFYPNDWLGTWKVQRQVTVPQTNNNNNEPSSSRVLQLEYSMRFIPSVQDNAVVADRGYNQAQLEAAILRQSAASQQQQQQSATRMTDTSTSIRYEWTETNPNDLRLVFPNGSRKDIKVTQRATEQQPSNDNGSFALVSSEVQRVTQQPPSTTTTSSSIPTVTARRVIQKWKTIPQEDTATSKNDRRRIVGQEVVYDLGLPGDPLQAALSTPSTPTVLSKSQMVLVRE